MYRIVKSLRQITAVILAGGLGMRLRSLVSDRPKVLAEVRGYPFLTYIFDQLIAFGLKHVVLCTGYLGEQVEATFGDSYGSLHLVYSQESLLRGTAGALRLALPFFKSDPVLVMNGDSFCEENLNAFYSWHCAQGANATLLLSKVPDTKRYGQVHTDRAGGVLKFKEKDEKNRPGWINAGIYLISRSLLLTIPESFFVSLEKDMFPGWIGQGLYSYRSRGRFLDIGTPEGYSKAEIFFSLDTNDVVGLEGTLTIEKRRRNYDY